MTTHIPALQLQMDFDIDQISPKFSWHMQRDGEEWSDVRLGTLKVQAGTQLRFSVTGGGATAHQGYPDSFIDFDILQLGVVTRPHILKCGPDDAGFEYAPPSPFKEREAVWFELNPKSDKHDAHGKPYRSECQVLRLTQELLVGKAAGIWDFSVIVVVQIERAKSPKRRRVFTLDTVLQVAAARPADTEAPLLQ